MGRNLSVEVTPAGTNLVAENPGALVARIRLTTKRTLADWKQALDGGETLDGLAARLRVNVVYLRLILKMSIRFADGKQPMIGVPVHYRAACGRRHVKHGEGRYPREKLPFVIVNSALSEGCAECPHRQSEGTLSLCPTFVRMQKGQTQQAAA